MTAGIIIGLIIGLVVGGFLIWFIHPSKKVVKQQELKIEEKEKVIEKCLKLTQGIRNEVEMLSDTLKVKQNQIDDLKESLEGFSELQEKVKKLTIESKDILLYSREQKEIFEMMLHVAKMKNESGALDFENLEAFNKIKSETDQKGVFVALNKHGFFNANIRLTEAIFKILKIKIPTTKPIKKK